MDNEQRQMYLSDPEFRDQVWSEWNYELDKAGVAR